MKKIITTSSILFALAFVGCMTEPKVETREYDVDCVYIVESDSTITPKCTMERSK